MLFITLMFRIGVVSLPPPPAFVQQRLHTRGALEFWVCWIDRKLVVLEQPRSKSRIFSIHLEVILVHAIFKRTFVSPPVLALLPGSPLRLFNLIHVEVLNFGVFVI